MLVALDENKKRVYANKSDKWNEYGKRKLYYCPECGDLLVLKKGEIRRPHFAHSKESTCSLSRINEESRVHELMKYHISEIIERNNNCIKSEIEWPLGNRIADYYCEIKDRFGAIKKIAIECIYKNDNIYDFMSKTRDYADMGIYVLWIFCANRFSSYCFDEALPIEKHTKWNLDIKINDVLTEGHKMYRNKIYALNIKDGTIWAVHLSKMMDGFRYPEPKLLNNFKISSFSTRHNDKFVKIFRKIAQPYILPWW